MRMDKKRFRSPPLSRKGKAIIIHDSPPAPPPHLPVWNPVLSVTARRQMSGTIPAVSLREKKGDEAGSVSWANPHLSVRDGAFFLREVEVQGVDRVVVVEGSRGRRSHLVLCKADGTRLTVSSAFGHEESATFLAALARSRPENAQWLCDDDVDPAGLDEEPYLFIMVTGSRMDHVLADELRGAEHRRLTLTASDLSTLREGEWVNDAIVDAFLALQETHMEIVSCFLYTKIIAPHFSLMDWPFPSLEAGTILFPVNLANTHWVLVVANLEGNTVTLFDSLHNGQQRTSVCETIAAYLNAVSLELGHGPRGPQTFLFPDVAQQRNGCDCGVHVLRNAMWVLSGAVEPLSRTDILATFHHASCRNIHVVFAEELPPELRCRIGVCVVLTADQDSTPQDLLEAINEHTHADIFLVPGKREWRQALPLSLPGRADTITIHN